MNKKQRLALIRELIGNQNFSKQGDLVMALQARGCHATQATISRDMDEMGIVKVPIGSGYRYSLTQAESKDVKPVDSPAPLVTVLNVSPKSPELPQLVTATVVPGTSRLVKRRLLDDLSAELFSVIADDDTVLAVAYNEAGADMVRAMLQGLKEA